MDPLRKRPPRAPRSSAFRNKTAFPASRLAGRVPPEEKRKGAVRLGLKAPRRRHSDEIGQFFAADYFWLGDRTGDLAAESGGRGPNGRKLVYSPITR